jgi:hypothetical protein
VLCSLALGAFLAAAPAARAGMDVIAYPEGLQYEETTTADAAAVTRDLDLLAPTFDARGFPSIATDEQGKRVRMLEVDDVFGEFDCDQMILAKWNIAPNNPRVLNKLVEDDGTFLFHGQTPAGVPYVLFFGNFSRDESARMAIEAQDRLSGKSPATSLRAPRGTARTAYLRRLWDAAFPSAQADQTSSQRDQIESSRPAPLVPFYRPQIDPTTGKPIPKAELVSRGCSAGRAPSSTGDVGDIQKAIQNQEETKKNGNKFVRFATSCGEAAGKAIINFIPNTVKDTIELTIATGRTVRDSFVPTAAEIAEAKAQGKKISVWSHVARPFKMVWKGLKDLGGLGKKYASLGKDFVKDAKKFTLEKWAGIICTVIAEVGADIALTALVTGTLIKTGAKVAGLTAKEGAQAARAAVNVDRKRKAVNEFNQIVRATHPEKYLEHY